MARYQTYLAGERKVIVVSRYAGKVVRGVAKCSPGDAFDAEKGEALARLRCDEKIAVKRVARAEAAYAEAIEAMQKAKKRVEAMAEYVDDAHKELYATREALNTFEVTL